ncbi:uncharacterized protein BDZ99DRAFT_459267 [Mytilinidion resinicola]|uniref:Uncharacterized protein n=1 Tax=Mytilinidion resinicola TaxID=574789 RepID=A0A6A6Z2N6_9PEZI|nr:uncharacterized protein BDZ99DRAFT_459267 [Mytilinidion resinicola]KAF2815381.1 hypothetical protein BDZ99DRAFT_459267 [Mytilinidion resinicola]
MSWAAVVGKATPSTPQQTASITQIPSNARITSAEISPKSNSKTSLQAPAIEAVPKGPANGTRPLVAFVSGHIDITPVQFRAQYASAIDTAIARGDIFVLSNAGGVDTMGLAYLRDHGVSPDRITIYMHTPRSNRKLHATQIRINAMRLGKDVEEKYEKEGYGIRAVQGYHNERDAAMTEESDYDILWVRDEADTAKLYGAKYRPGRVSGTQKNKNRRVVKEKRAE